MPECSGSTESGTRLQRAPERRYPEALDGTYRASRNGKFKLSAAYPQSQNAWIRGVDNDLLRTNSQADGTADSRAAL
jgi:hypothetical protein